MTTMTLDDVRRYAESVARDETMTRPHLREDAAQEGLIAGWKAQVDRPTATPAYVKKAVRNAVFDTVVRGRSTGSERPSGHHLVGEDATLGLVVEGEHGPMLRVDPEDEATRVLLDEVEVYATRKAVKAAVSALDPADRLHVFLRFWQGLTARQVAEETGSTEARVAARWNVTIRPALREALTAGGTA